MARYGPHRHVGLGKAEIKAILRAELAWVVELQAKFDAAVPSRNKWHMLCAGLQHLPDPDETCVAEVVSMIDRRAKDLAQERAAHSALREAVGKVLDYFKPWSRCPSCGERRQQPDGLERHHINCPMPALEAAYEGKEKG